MTFQRPYTLLNKAFHLIGAVLVSAGLTACGVGSSYEDPSAAGADGGGLADPGSLSITLSGQTKYRADEGVSLSYSVTGSASGDATVAYDGPVELTHDRDAKTISGEALLAGTYTVTVTATSGNLTAEDELRLDIDANFGGSYSGSGDSTFSLTMGRSQVTETDENNYVLTRSGTLFWYSQATDATAFINRLCAADVTVRGDEAEGTGICKDLVDDQMQVFTVNDLLITSEETGELGISYSYEENSKSFDINFAPAGEAYVSPDLVLDGIYRSTLLDDLNYLRISAGAIVGDSYDIETPRCGINATLTPYDISLITATEGDGRIIPMSEMVIDNCDLSSSDGYKISVGNASGSDQDGLLLILQSGISDSVIRFDIYARRGDEFPDPLSKLRFVRVCYEGLPTSQAELYDVTEDDCDALTPAPG